MRAAIDAIDGSANTVDVVTPGATELPASPSYLSYSSREMIAALLTAELYSGNVHSGLIIAGKA